MNIILKIIILYYNHGVSFKAANSFFSIFFIFKVCMSKTISIYVSILLKISQKNTYNNILYYELSLNVFSKLFNLIWVSVRR